MRDPNFFIIGAPKCGTTAMSEYLRPHPRIFMSFPKEPNHFCKDMPGRIQIADNDKYRALFAEADDTHQAVGEASVHYLRSYVAVPDLLKDYPDPRIIAMVRNPVTFLPSWHNQIVYSLTEPVTDFEEAWRLQEPRRRGEQLPRNCQHPRIFDYADAAMFGEQTQRLLEHVPRERVLFLKFEDFVADTRGAYQSILGFLGVDDDGRDDFPQTNAAHQHKSRTANLLVRKGYKALSKVNFLDRQNPVRRLARKGLKQVISANQTYHKPQKASPALAAEIYDTLKDDIDLFERLSGLDLADWRRLPETGADTAAADRMDGMDR